jgi:hypothetical protein
VIAGAAMGARGLAAYLAKKKAKDIAKKAVMKTGYGGTKIHDAMVMSPRAAAMASARGRVYPDASRFVSTQGNRAGAGFKELGLMGLATGAGIYGADSLINHPRNEAMNKMRGGDYIASPMMGKSHDPSYEASKTRAGKVQTMMEEMDGMDISEEGKRQIIEDKLRLPYGYLEDVGLEMAWGGDRFDGGYSGDLRQETGASMTASEMKASYFDRIASNPSLPMDQRITAALRRETGAAFSTEEAIEMIQKLEARDKQALINQTGAATTREELGMFMGMPKGR